MIRFLRFSGLGVCGLRWRFLSLSLEPDTLNLHPLSSKHGTPYRPVEHRTIALQGLVLGFHVNPNPRGYIGIIGYM